MTDGTPLLIHHIEAKPETGTPRIAGKGILVSFVAHLMDDPEWTIERVCSAYDLTPGQVYAALSYYEDHKEEIERGIAASEARLDEYFAQHPEADAYRQKIMGKRQQK